MARSLPFADRRDLRAFHPELRRAARFLPRHGLGPRSLRAVRALIRPLAKRVPSGVEVEAVGDITVRIQRPTESPDGPLPALLWLHGGGMVVGTAAQDDVLLGRVARELRCLVASVEYRLAPEHPYPTPLEDCYAALRWLAARPDVDERRIAIGGASAGGGLAAGLALLARDRAEVSPVHQVLVYPMLDDRTATRTDLDERNVRLWDQRSNAYGWRCYLGQAPGSAGVAPYAAPARADDLAGLPPAWLGVGTLDVFHDEDVEYARRLREAGVDCHLEVVDGAFHGFDLVAKAAVTKAFHGSWMRMVGDAFRPVSTPGGAS